MKHNTRKATASNEYKWIVKNKKQEQTEGEDPVQTLVEFGKTNGTRGEIRVSQWKRESGMLRSTGVSFKGTFKEVVEQLKKYVTEATASDVESITIKEVVKALKLLKFIRSKDGLWRKTSDDMKGSKATVVIGPGRKSNTLDVKVTDEHHGINVFHLKQGDPDIYRKLSEINDYVVAISHCPLPPSVPVVATEVTAAPSEDEDEGKEKSVTGSSLLGNAIIGDLKRIKSLIATWSSKKGKGAPPPEQLKEYVAYQKDVAGYIAKTYISKLPDNYKKKVKAI